MVRGLFVVDVCACVVLTGVQVVVCGRARTSTAQLSITSGGVSLSMPHTSRNGRTFSV